MDLERNSVDKTREIDFNFRLCILPQIYFDGGGSITNPNRSNIT